MTVVSHVHFNIIFHYISYRVMNLNTRTMC